VKSGAASINRGSTLLYTITVTNHGPDMATSVVMQDPVPAGLTFSAAESDSSCVLNGSNVLCNTFQLSAGGSKTVGIAFLVPQTATCGSEISNQATVATATTDPNPSNNASSVVKTTVTCPQPTFTISKTDGKAAAAPGETLTYTITVTNTSSVNATDVKVEDTLPPGVTVISISDGGLLALPQSPTIGGVVIWSGLSVNAGQSKTLTVVVAIQQNVANGTVLTNTGTVSTVKATDVTTVVVPSPTLTIAKTDGKTTVAPGETSTYTISIQNTSSVDASGLTVTDVLPSGVTFVSASNGGSALSGTVTWTNVSVSAGTTTHLTVTVTVNQGLGNGTILTNTASVSGKSAQDTTIVHVVAQPTFTITKTDGKATATPGETLTYTITVTNTSSVNASNVTVTDTLPENVSFLTASGGVRNGSVVTWTGVALNAGQSKTFTLQVQVNTGVSNGTVLTNTASVGSVSGQDQTTVQTGQPALTLDLTDSKDPVNVGETFVYTVRLTNTSATPASTVTVQLILDGDVEYQSASNAGTHSNGIVTWTGVSVPGNSTTTLTASVRVNTGTRDSEILNSTAISGSLSDPETTLVRDNGNGNRDITITVRDSKDPVRITECYDYILTVRNNRNQSERLSVTGFLDDDTDFQSADRGGNLIGGSRVEWNNISIGSNSSETLRASVCVTPGAFDGQSLRFRARAESAEDTEYTRVIDDGFLPPPIPPIPPIGPIPPVPPVGGGLTIDKRADREEAQPGSAVLYTITIHNDAPVPTGNLIIEDIFSAGTMTVEEAGGGVITGNGITWNGVTLGANTTRVLQYRVRVSSSMQHGQTVSNTVTARDGVRVITDTENVRILRYLPQTGTVISSDGSEFLRPRNTQEESSAFPISDLPWMLWTQIVAMGMGVGGFFGKKLLIGL
jgi:uncharacterized repeat protein (TIGR01451 family)